MARSRRKNPACGCAVADSDKPYKVMENRRARRSAKVRVRVGDDPLPEKAFGDPWGSPKDGHIYLGARMPDKLWRK